MTAVTWSERLNPIVVKEVRQGLRTRVFWIFFGLMLFACLCISLIAWATASELGFDGGRGFFIAFYVCLSIVQFFIIPYTAYRSMAREREDETWVLLTARSLAIQELLLVLRRTADPRLDLWILDDHEVPGLSVRT